MSGSMLLTGPTRLHISQKKIVRPIPGIKAISGTFSKADSCGPCNFIIRWRLVPQPLTQVYATLYRNRSIGGQTRSYQVLDACRRIDHQIRERTCTAFEAQNKRLAVLLENWMLADSESLEERVENGRSYYISKLGRCMRVVERVK